MDVFKLSRSRTKGDSGSGGSGLYVHYAIFGQFWRHSYVHGDNCMDVCLLKTDGEGIGVLRQGSRYIHILLTRLIKKQIGDHLCFPLSACTVKGAFLSEHLGNIIIIISFII